MINDNENPINKRRSNGFWKKLFLICGFLGVVYYLVWKDYNNSGNEDNDDEDNDDNGNNKKKQKKDKNGYFLLNNNEDLDI